MSEYMLYDGTKSVKLKDLPESAWQFLTGGEYDSVKNKAVKQVPWLRRSIQIRKWAVGSMPFIITKKGETEPIDSSERYQNVIGFLPNPRRLLRQIEESIAKYGKAYLFKDDSLAGTPIIRYYNPNTVRPDYDDMGRIKQWMRTRGASGTEKPLDKERVIYFWPEDADVENGPPKGSDVDAALHAAGVLISADEFIEKYFQRGTIKPTILRVGGLPPQEEKDRLRNWWKRVFSGVDNSFETGVVEAEKMEAVVIGEGLAGLQDNDLTAEKRQDIATALGIPMTLVFSQAANRATASQDYKQLYQLTIVPQCELIEEVLNSQLLFDHGYQLKFHKESLDVYQEDEEKRAVSLQQICSTGVAVDLAMEILGYDLTENQWQRLRETMKQRFAEQRVIDDPKDANGAGASGRGGNWNNEKSAEDLDKWLRKSLKWLERGKGAACPFESDNIDPLMHASVMGMLDAAETADEVKAVFADVWLGYP